MRKAPKVRVIAATEAKNRFGELIKAVYLNEEHLIVKRDDIPVVAVLPIGDYHRLISADGLVEDIPADLLEELRAARERSEGWTSFREFLKKVHEKMPDVPEAEAEQDILEAVRAVREERRAERARERQAGA